ncbi:MAG: PEP-CTERM sorting domain-containing protein [Phycisphaerae bacterium]
MLRSGHAVRVCAMGAAMFLAVFSGWAALPARAKPITGIYKSDDMDVDPAREFLTGRYSEGFSGDPLGVGNGAHAGSWDPPNLSMQWELAGPIVLPGPTIIDNTVGGTGDVIALREFDVSAATLVLRSGGPWTGSGDPDYTVDLDFYSQQVTSRFKNGTMVFAESTESFTGDFVGYPDYRLVGMASGAMVDRGAPLPAGYPSWIPVGAVTGSWGEVGLIQFEIVPEPASLLLVAAGLGGVWLARRRR